MARSPITWRQVSGGQAGNPASAMGTAIQGFGMAGRGALDLNTDLRKGEAIRNAELTQRTIGNVMASGKPLDAQALGDFAPGVNTTDVLESVLGARATQADTDYRRELAETEAAGNTPEALQRKIDHENRLATIQERTLDIRNSELQSQLNARKATQTDRTNATKLDTGWDTYRAQGLAPKEQEVQAAIAEIQNGPLSDQEKITAIDGLNQELNIYRNEWETENLNNYLSDAYKNNPGMSATAINASRAGQLQNQLTTRATKLAEQRQEADIAYAKEQDTLLGQVSGGVNLHAMTLDANGEVIPITNKKAAARNKMEKNELYEMVRSDASDFLWSKDEEIPKEAAKRLDAIYDILDGNRTAISTLMDNTNWSYDSEGVDWGFSAPDEVHGLPTTQAAQEVANKFMQAATTLKGQNRLVGRPKDKPVSQLDQTLAGLRSVQTQRNQQNVAQQYGIPGLDAGLGQQLQDTITRLSASKIGAPDPRLQR
jgi:hypothetical protein